MKRSTIRPCTIEIGSSGSYSPASPNMCANTSASKTLPEGAEILLSVECISETDTLGDEMGSGNARALIGGNLHPLPVLARGPSAVELAAGAGRGRQQDLLSRRR